MTYIDTKEKPIALLSVTDKNGVVEFGKDLASLGYEILSTGGTAKALREGGVDVTDVSTFTGSPEILDGRVKTLNPKVHGGILMDRANPDHVKTANDHGIRAIDLVVVNLYEFEKEAANKAMDLSQAINYIDIGGPTMLRAAAKNYENTTAVIDPDDYEGIIRELRVEGGLNIATKTRLAGKAFRKISQYDNFIANYFEGKSSSGTELRYGENPHQKAHFYPAVEGDDGLQNAKVLQGKELSYNNYLDIDAATALVRDFSQNCAVAIIKHTNPCGVALGKAGESVVSTYERALSCDSRSAFGGIVAVNRPIDKDTAAKMSELFLECIAAPSFTDEARDIFAKKKNLRLLEVPFLKTSSLLTTPLLRSIQGGTLSQSPDTALPSKDSWKVVTNKKPTREMEEDLLFAQVVCKHVKSNAIVFARDLCTVAIGAGQMSRVDSATFSVRKARDLGHVVENCVMASDAFFPFRDTVDLAADFDVTAIIQPGGSKRDQESIDAANEHGMTMVMTGTRHFKH